jgi:predicted transcriptional regulator
VHHKYSIVDLLPEKDIIRAMAQHGQGSASMEISKFIAPRLKIFSMKDRVHDVIRAMHKRRFRHMSVIENAKPKGFVSIGDLLTCELGME